MLLEARLGLQNCMVLNMEGATTWQQLDQVKNKTTYYLTSVVDPSQPTLQ